jgi:hypothetical protein
MGISRQMPVTMTAIKMPVAGAADTKNTTTILK